MKRVAFPHMGQMNIAVKSFLWELGVEPIEPPQITKRTMDLGVQHAPEFACLPLKVNLGNHLEALEQGADVILMAGGVGPCRFGYYAEVQREILRDLGHDVEMLTIEPNARHIYHSFNSLHGKRIPLTRLYRILRYVMEKILAVDELEQVCQWVRPRTSRHSELNSRFRQLLHRMEEATTIESVREVKEWGKEWLREIAEKVDEDELIHMGVVGEIYVVLEPFVNLQIEERLGKLGVQVHRELFLGHWIRDHILRQVDRTAYLEAAGPYLNQMIGGHGQETIGQTVLYARQGLAGVVQVAPFTCMPEIVAESILPTVSRQEGVPILSLFFDEHSGEAGLQTRLEAFVDLVRRKRRSVVI